MIDITPLCVRLEKVGDDRVRMVIYCAPGFSGTLSQQLRRFGVRRKNKHAVVVTVPTQIARLAAELGLEPGLVALLERYKEGWVGANHGVRVDTARLAGRKERVNALVSFENGLYFNGSPPNPNTIEIVPPTPPSPRPLQTSPVRPSPPHTTPPQHRSP